MSGNFYVFWVKTIVEEGIQSIGNLMYQITTNISCQGRHLTLSAWRFGIRSAPYLVRLSDADNAI